MRKFALHIPCLDIRTMPGSPGGMIGDPGIRRGGQRERSEGWKKAQQISAGGGTVIFLRSLNHNTTAPSGVVFCLLNCQPCHIPYCCDANVQFNTSWVAVAPPVAPVKPMYALVPPTVVGISIGHDSVKAL